MSKFLIPTLLFLGVSAKLPRGIDIKQRHLYENQNGHFKCIISGELIPYADLNDDYCDCLDGSDEPGTSACAFMSNQDNTFTGFWCRNAGHLPRTISPTLVDDGICDCCDGSDESNPDLCSNICLEVGAADRERRAKESELANAGFKIRQEWSKQGLEEQKNALGNIRSLDIEIQDLKTKRTEQNRKRDDLIRIETAEKRRCREIEKEKLQKEQIQARLQRKKKIFNFFDSDNDDWVSAEELAQHKFVNPDPSGGEFTAEKALKLMADIDPVNLMYFSELFLNTDGKESVVDLDKYFDQEGNLIPNPPETSESNEQEPTQAPRVQDNEDQENMPQDPDLSNLDEDLEINDQYHSNNFDSDYEDDDDFDNDSFDDEDFDNEDYGDDEEYDHEEYRKNSIKKHNADNNIGLSDADAVIDMTLDKYDEAAQIAINNARNARTESSELDRKIRDMENSLKKLENKNNFDFGPDKAFSALFEKCIDLRTTEYIYEVCLFKSASQRQISGGGNTSLGNWKNADTDDNGNVVANTGSWRNNYTQHSYTGGVRCWNGPDRSCNVIFKCGAETKLIDASEPQRCEYQFEVETPAVCEQVEDNSLDVEESFRHEEL